MTHDTITGAERGSLGPDATTTRVTPGPVAVASAGAVLGLRITATGVTRTVKGGTRILSEVSFSVAPGELLAVVGGSGAGKTTLLEAVAGVSPIDAGTVTYDGADLSEDLGALRSAFGYVPQDDIIHMELPVETTLRYAARLRLPESVSDEQIEARVRETLEVLDLTDRAHVRVGSLSGGQRRRVSIGVELLTRPRVFFLDEPTSGLDPATQAELMRLLRRLADAGSTVVMTTHSPENVRICDKVLFLTRQGSVAFFGVPAAALDYFAVDGLSEVYERLAEESTTGEWARRFQQARQDLDEDEPAADGEPTGDGLPDPGNTEVDTVAGPGFLPQWRVLTRRNFEIIVRNRLTLAILLGSPVMVVFMLTVLFRPGVFDPAAPNPAAAVMIVYWISFGGFFFGVTYGLLQIVSEFAIFRRERLVGVGVGAYVLSKLAVLVPFLLLVDVAMLGVLRAFDRLPDLPWHSYLSLGTTLLLDAVAALALGLLASALVRVSAQATLALPVICWPQVLFSGALVAVPVMALVGRWMSALMSNRWAFEAMGHDVGLNQLFATGHSPLGPPLLAQYGTTFSHPVWIDWLVLAGFAAVSIAAACRVLARRTNAA